MLAMQETDVFIHPGEWYFSDKNIRIRTMLGSCVAVTLWHPGLKIGGMCHYLLPANKPKETRLNARYGRDAIALMVQTIKRSGGNPREYQAKIFGGASMFDTIVNDLAVGHRNIELAREQLASYGLPVVAEDTGGDAFRQLIFNLEDGAVWLRHGAAREEQQATVTTIDFGRLV